MIFSPNKQIEVILRKSKNRYPKVSLGKVI